MTVFRMAYDDGALRISRASSPAVLAIAGDIDEYSQAGLVDTLRRLTDGYREIHISLGDVAFCDLAGLRAIIGLTWPGSEDHDRPRARLVLHEIPRQLNRILQILGWDTTPGLAIREPDQHCAAACHAAGRVAERGHHEVLVGPAVVATIAHGS
jgi:anti-anti-sigma regulatory factor